MMKRINTKMRYSHDIICILNIIKYILIFTFIGFLFMVSLMLDPEAIVLSISDILMNIFTTKMEAGHSSGSNSEDNPENTKKIDKGKGRATFSEDENNDDQQITKKIDKGKG